MTSTPEEARARFAAIVESPDGIIDVPEAALWIAAEACPGLDVAARLREIDALAERGRYAVDGPWPQRDKVERLNHFLFVSERFRGSSQESYYDPRNSFLNEVLDRRVGIPITLSVLYVGVARRLGLDAAGVGFPGHFLAKVGEGEHEILVDPFTGAIVSHEECRERLRATLGGQPELDPEMLDPAQPREILVRILTNLKHVYLEAQQHEDVLRCCDRILLLAPDAPFELRDRGLVLRQLECFGPALADLERFVALAPDHSSAQIVVQELETLRRQVRRIN